jgi:hypothetical protein
LKNEGRYSSYEAVSSHQQDWIILWQYNSLQYIL